MNFEDLKNTVSNITLYDVKSAIRKAQNVVLNYSEMEAKVREATNNEPWGASSTLMQEIANGTYSYQSFNEIMQMLYKRFTDKSAEEWRQIYKVVAVLEEANNGSERVVDDARTHIATIKILRNFHFIDTQGKDQGINVRNRAKELAELLSDSDKIRTERKKAKAARTKYTGVGSDDGGFGGTGKKYGGFGSDDLSYGSYSGQVYGDGGGFTTGGYGGSDFQDRPSRSQQYEEYDEFDDGGATARASTRSSIPRKPSTKEAPPPAPKEKDLFSFDDDETAPAPAPANGKGKAPVAAISEFDADDDFDDFQSATSPTTTTTSTTVKDLPSLFVSSTFQPPKPSTPSTASTFTSFAIPSPQPSMTSSFPTTTTATPSYASTPQFLTSPPASKPLASPSGPNYFSQPTPTTTTTTTKPSTDAFGSLWSSALGKDVTKKPAQEKVSMAQLAQEKSTNALWGQPAPSNAQEQSQKSSSGLDDLLL